MALGDWRTLVDDRVRDSAAKLTQPQKDAAIADAAKVYSRARPRRRLQEITGTGTAFTFVLANDFEDGFSAVLAVEFPVGKQCPEYLDEDEFAVRRQLDGTLKLHWFARTLPDQAKAHVTYTVRHLVAAGDDTVPIADRDAGASLAAAICARQLGMLYTQTSDPTLTADAVSYRTKGEEYFARAKELEAAYNRHLGLEGPARAASVSKDLDVTLQGGHPRFFHAGRDR